MKCVLSSSDLICADTEEFYNQDSTTVSGELQGKKSVSNHRIILSNLCLYNSEVAMET